jgi:hypothetical protein
MSGLLGLVQHEAPVLPDAASGWVRMSQTISARKRKPTILRTFTDNHRSASELSP